MEPLNQNLPIDDRIFVSLLEDSGFKAVMADKANKQLLIGLLNEVLPPHDHIVDIVQYLDREQGLNTVNSKRTVLDLVCLTDDQRTIDIEVQRKMDGYFFQRCFYYAAGLYHRELSRKTKSTGSSSRSMSSVSSPGNLPSKKKTARNPTKSLQGI